MFWSILTILVSQKLWSEPVFQILCKKFYGIAKNPWIAVETDLIKTSWVGILVCDAMMYRGSLKEAWRHFSATSTMMSVTAVRSTTIFNTLILFYFPVLWILSVLRLLISFSPVWSTRIFNTLILFYFPVLWILSELWFLISFSAVQPTSPVSGEELYLHVLWDRSGGH